MLVKHLWYSGLEIPDISKVCTDNLYNDLPTDIYEAIIAECKDNRGWEEAHNINREVYVYNSGAVYSSQLRRMYYCSEHFADIPWRDIALDIMSYLSGARRVAGTAGTRKVMKIFTTESYRRFIEVAMLLGMPNMSIAHNMSMLDPSGGSYSDRTRTFWNATKSTLKTNGIRVCDVREYLDLDEENSFYDFHSAYLQKDESALLVYYGLADYSVIVRKNKHLHGMLNSKLSDAISNNSRQVLPSDYVRLYMHIDAAITDAEVGDKGVEEYRKEIERIKERTAHTKEEYVTMDQLKNMVIKIDENVEKDEPFMPKVK